MKNNHRSGTLDISALHLLHRAGQCAEVLFTNETGKADLTPRQYAILASVAQNPDISQTGLVEQTGVDRSTLADIVRRFSSNQLRISIEQNIYLPWVREESLWDLYIALSELSLAERGAGTITDVTTCPGSDTCRLGIASAKGLGSE